MDKTKQQFLPLVLSVSILSLLTAYFIFAGDGIWTEPDSSPPSGGNIDAPIDTGPTNQTKRGDLTVDIFTVSGGVLSLHDSTEGNIGRVDEVIGYNDLFLQSNATESNPIYIAGSELNFYSNGSELQWRIDSEGKLTKGSIPWERLTDFPSYVCPEENQFAVGMNEDGLFECTFVDYCENLHKCAETDDKGECVEKENPENDLPACQKCSTDSLDPIYYEAGTQDAIGTGPQNVCDNSLGKCYMCDGKGNCTYQPLGSNIGNPCDTSGCFTGYCSGTGYSCEAYDTGKHNCGTCMKCNPDGSGGCIPQSSDEDLANECSVSGCRTGYCIGGYVGEGSACETYGCPVCHGCLGDGESCGPVTTNWGANSFGCEGNDKRCYNGSCVTCDGYLYNDGCGGCAGQGGKGCWHSSFGQSCDTICSSYGGCISANWDDQYHVVCDYFFHDSASMFISDQSENWAPAFKIVDYYDYHGYACINRDQTNQNCSTGISDGYRMCVCQY
jgi:hypothetical protein